MHINMQSPVTLIIIKNLPKHYEQASQTDDANQGRLQARWVYGTYLKARANFAGLDKKIAN